MTHMDEDSMIALQMTVLGLTITEWMAKLREEVSGKREPLRQRAGGV